MITLSVSSCLNMYVVNQFEQIGERTAFWCVGANITGQKLKISLYSAIYARIRVKFGTTHISGGAMVHHGTLLKE